MNDSIVITLLEDEGRTASGIVLPDSADPMFSKGLVKAIGPGKLLDNGERLLSGALSVGDKVLFARYAATKIEDEGTTLFFTDEADILAKIS